MSHTISVTKHNFYDRFKEIKNHIDRSVFIGIDSEFSGLNVKAENRSSLFDTPSDRYKKIKANVNSLAILQFGLTAFVSVDTHRYEAHTYSFYLCPVADGNLDIRFTLQSSSVQFLTQHKFDFNKVFYEGIPYLNNEQSEYLKQHYAVLSSTGDIDPHQKDLLRKYCSAIARWLVQARDGDIYTYEKLADDGELPNHMIHARILHTMDTVWPLPSENQVLIVQKVSKTEREKLLNHSNLRCDDLSQTVIDARGFSEVIRHLSEQKKPVVGHNVYMDFMFIHDKFIDHLPSSYDQYKASLHKALPEIYDTKHISLQMRKRLRGTMSEYESTMLSSLYSSLKQNRDSRLYAPTIITKHQEDDGRPDGVVVEGQIHDAGFDSYMCGYVFLRLAHELAINNLGKEFAQHPLPFYEYVPHLQPYKNMINLIRGRCHCICLDGPDPEASDRPDTLFIRTKGYRNSLDTDEVSLLFSSFGSVDINKMAADRAIVAVGNFHCARRILQAFKYHDRYKVEKYSYWRHSLAMRKLFWTGLALSAGVCSWAVLKGLRRKS